MMADLIAAASTQSRSSMSSVCADARHGLLSWMQMDHPECPCISLSASCLIRSDGSQLSTAPASSSL
jgi:hypothetical protein